MNVFIGNVVNPTKEFGALEVCAWAEGGQQHDLHNRATAQHGRDIQAYLKAAMALWRAEGACNPLCSSPESSQLLKKRERKPLPVLQQKQEGSLELPGGLRGWGWVGVGSKPP